LYSRQHDEEVQFYAFDMLAGEGDDMRSLPLSMTRRTSRLLARRSDGIFITPFEQGEIGPDLFRTACNMGFEGLVSKHRDPPYRGGRWPHCIKVKNPTSPAMTRAKEVDWSSSVHGMDRQSQRVTVFKPLLVHHHPRWLQEGMRYQADDGCYGDEQRIADLPTE